MMLIPFLFTCSHSVKQFDSSTIIIMCTFKAIKDFLEVREVMAVFPLDFDQDCCH